MGPYIKLRPSTVIWRTRGSTRRGKEREERRAVKVDPADEFDQKEYLFS